MITRFRFENIVQVAYEHRKQGTVVASPCISIAPEPKALVDHGNLNAHHVSAPVDLVDGES